MNKKNSLLLLVIALSLTACAQAVTSTPVPSATNKLEPTAILQPTAYPDPLELVPLPTASDSVYPYPSPSDSNSFPGNNDVIELLSGINTDLAPQAGDLNLAIGPAYVEIAKSETFMAVGDQPVALHLVGNVPNPCYQLRVVVHEPDDKNNLMVEAYSVADPEKMCADMLQPFDETVRLDMLAAGKYTVFINEEELGTIEIK